ncbi:hypothetical protein NPA08_02240 [Mycoplasmopsis citelli]|uniref:hypothetical protein n=1 Tax=Mycoplasmopsis citelli TaxID=171281 RepID=UPI0021141576|nr:hypothetical protein [Mycoplasmopsis citelli]UUD36624.1 hypothetical protein NPA08_02240 [Mycoplasmopsis citelli]
MQKFYEIVDPLIEKQNQFSLELETKIWTNHEQLVKNTPNLFSTQEKSVLLSTIDQILSLLAQPQYSRDAIVEYEQVYDKMINKLAKSKVEETKILNNFLENVIRVRNEINILDLNNHLKDNSLNRIDNYKSIALNSAPTLAVTKAKEIEYLNDLVNNELKTLIDETPDKNKLLVNLSQVLSVLKASSFDNNVKKLVNQQVKKIQENPSESEGDLLNSIAQATNLTTAIKNIDNLATTIKDQTITYVAERNLSPEDAQNFQTQLSDILESSFENINQYLEKLNNLYNNIYDNVLLGSVFKNSLKKLNEQILNSLKKGKNVNKSDLTQMLNQVTTVLNGNVSVKELNETLRTKSNELREINRIELRNWYNISKPLVEEENNLDAKIKDKLRFLNSKAILLIPSDSTAIREDLQFLIDQYQQELQKANISEGLQDTLDKFTQTKEAINAIFVTDSGEITSAFGKKLQEQALELRKQAQITAQNPNLTDDQKKDKFLQIAKGLDNLAKNAQAFKQLEAKIASGEITIASSSGKKAEQTFLEKEALRINQVKVAALEALDNASSNVDVANLISQMDNAIAAYKEKQAEYQSTQALKDNFNLINQIFAPYSLNGVPTPMQKKILDKLSTYQQQLTDTNLTNEQRDNINSEIAKLMDVVEDAKDLEVKNNALKNLVNETQNNDYGTFKPENQFNSAKNLNTEVDTFLNTLFNPNFDKSQIAQKANDLEQKHQELALAISVALLRKTNQEIQDNKVTGANISQSPYTEINASIESINTVTQNLINDNNKTQAQVDELENNIKNYLKLAKTLKASADKLQTLNQTNNPIAYEALRKALLDKPNSGTANEPNNTLIHFGDSISVIDFKTRILGAELAKTPTRLQAENNIKTLEAVYGANERNRAIFDDAIRVFETKIADYKVKIAQFYATNANLATLRDDIDFATQKEQQIKNAIDTAWNDALTLKSSLQNDYNASKTADGLRNSTHTDNVFAEFENLKDNTDNSGKKTTLTSQLLAKLDELPLAYTKDSFIQSAEELTSKINVFDNYSTEIQNNYSNSWKGILISWKDALKNTVNSYNLPADLLKIRRDYQKVSSLTSLIGQFKIIFDYFDTTSKSNPSQKNIQILMNTHPNNALFNKLQQVSQYQNADEATLYSKSSESIISLRNELRDLYFDVVSLEDAKASESDKIQKYKTSIDAKLDALASVDSGLKDQIDAKLQQLLSQTNAVTQKADLVAIDNALSEIEFKEENLKNLAIKTKVAQDLVAANSNIPASDTGKQALINSISDTYNAYKDSYLTIAPVELISKEKELEDKIALFNKFTAVYAKVQSDKANIPDATTSTHGYATGTGTHGTPQDGKSKMEGYFDHLIDLLNQTPVTQGKIFNVENTLNSLEKLINLQKDKLNIQNQVLNDSTNNYNNFEYKTGMRANYGFESDAKELADAILKSIPDNNKTATELETELIPTLVNEFQNAYDLYLARKNALETLYKNNANDKGIKVTEVEQLFTTNTTNVDSQFTALKEKADDFFHTQAEQIKNANNVATIDEAIRNAIEIDVFFEKYKKLAELVAQATTAKNKVNAMTNIANNVNVTGSIAKLDAEITKATGYYYTQKDSSLLDNNIFLLDTYIARLNFATQVATKQNELDNLTTTPSNNDYLTAQAKAPLTAILNTPFNELNANTSLETKENYANLLEKYITGSSNSSFNIGFINSKILQANIHKAQEYLTSYKAKIASNSNYEPQNIKDLYTALETKINEATVALNDNNHNEETKLRLASELYNSNNGALDEILKAESDKAKVALALHLQLDKYLANNYPNPNSNPKLQDYENIAINSIKNVDISTAQKLETFNDTLATAQTKFTDQQLALFKWEANRYNSYKDKFNEFYTFLNAANTNGASKEFVLKVTGITQVELDNFNNAANPNAADALHTNAQSYAQKANESDANIKTFLAQNNADDIINKLTNVANEFFNYYQNLISIKSIPSILLGISNFTRIKNELTDSQQDHNVRFALKNTNSETAGLTTKITDYLNDLVNISNNSSNDIRNETSEGSVSFANGTPANITTQRTDYFNKYKEIVVAIAKAKEKLDQIVFGTSANDNDTLQKVLHKFIEGVTGFAGRANIANILQFIASQTQLAPNLPAADDKFSAVKNEYAKIANPSIESENTLANLPKNASDIDIYSAISRGFSFALQLFDWTKDINNTNLFFDYLTKSENGTLNYEDIAPKDDTSLESFKQKLEDPQITEENIEIDGTMHSAKKINPQINANGGGMLGDLFDKFNILKGTNNFFNTSNVEVFLYKDTAPNSEYVRSRLTADPSIKRGFVNLYFRFTKPTSLNNNDSAFGTVTNFGIKFENVGINFKTLDQFIIHKENIQDTNKLNETLFTADQAGWNNLQAPVRLFGVFNKYSTLKLIRDNKYYFTEGVNDPIDAPASNTTNSSPNFRVKVKLSGPYKGWSQAGSTIFWKTLNPNFTSDTGLQHQNGNNYLDGLLSSNDRNTHHYTTDYQYQYQQNVDQGKNLLFLPIVIGIPVFSTTGSTREAGLMVITWQILNRFDKDPSSTVQNISLGSADVLRHVDIYKRTPAGKAAGAPTANEPQFWDYVMSKIRIRDLASLTFDNLRGSSLWAADANVEKDTANSGKGGVGYQDFMNVVEKFDIKFKLH